MIALTRCPAILNRTEKKKEREQGDKKHKGNRRKGDLSDCRDETEMAEKLNRARDRIHCLIVIGGQVTMSSKPT